MKRDIKKGQSALMEVKKGVDRVCDPVVESMGPRGMNTILRNGFGEVVNTNDGKLIADHITGDTPTEDLGVDLAKAVSDKINEETGDLRSTSLSLFQSVLANGIKRREVGFSPSRIREGINRAVVETVGKIREMSIKADDIVFLERVASIAADNKQIGKIIAEAMDKVGKDGIVTTEPSNVIGVTYEVTKGLEIDRGFVSGFMTTDDNKNVAEYADVPVLVTDQRISAVNDLFPIMKKCAEKGIKGLVVIAEDITDIALQMVLVNKMNGGIPVLGIKAPSYGDRRVAMLKDIAAVTGATFISGELKSKLSEVEIDDLGMVRSISSTETKTVIVGPGTEETLKSIADRVTQLKSQLETSDADKYNKENLEQRIAKLSAGTGVIKVGAVSEREMEFLRKKVNDGIAAVRGAITDGVVAGGGSALLRISKVLDSSTIENHDERIGFEIVRQALAQPFRQILKNAGHEDASAIIEKVLSGGENAGYDVDTDQFIENMIESGIVDSALSVLSAVQQSAHEAGMILIAGTSNAVAEEAKG